MFMRGVANGSNDNIFSAKYFCHFTYLLVFKEKQKQSKTSKQNY